jgi:hypothetical protein
MNRAFPPKWRSLDIGLESCFRIQNSPNQPNGEQPARWSRTAFESLLAMKTRLFRRVRLHPGSVPSSPSSTLRMSSPHRMWDCMVRWTNDVTWQVCTPMREVVESTRLTLQWPAATACSCVWCVFREHGRFNSHGWCVACRQSQRIVQPLTVDGQASTGAADWSSRLEIEQAAVHTALKSTAFLTNVIYRWLQPAVLVMIVEPRFNSVYNGAFLYGNAFHALICGDRHRPSRLLTRSSIVVLYTLRSIGNLEL